jgi:hypothetical protein
MASMSLRMGILLRLYAEYNIMSVLYHIPAATNQEFYFSKQEAKLNRGLDEVFDDLSQSKIYIFQ